MRHIEGLLTTYGNFNDPDLLVWAKQRYQLPKTGRNWQQISDYLTQELHDIFRLGYLIAPSNVHSIPYRRTFVHTPHGHGVQYKDITKKMMELYFLGQRSLPASRHFQNDYVEA